MPKADGSEDISIDYEFEDMILVDEKQMRMVRFARDKLAPIRDLFKEFLRSKIIIVFLS